MNEALNQALQALKDGQLQEAQRRLEAILARAPGEPDALQLLGMVYKRLGDQASAIACLQASIAARPEQPNVLNNLGNLLRHSDGPAAEACFLKAIALVPGYGDAHANLGSLLLSRGLDEQAHDVLLKATQLSPGLATAWDGLSVAALRLGKIDIAINAARNAARLAPSSGIVLGHLGEALLAGDLYEEAIQALQGATQHLPDIAAIWETLGHACRYAGRSQDAKASYERALLLDPTLLDAHRNLSQLLWTSAGPQSAPDLYLAGYRAAIARAPADGNLRAAQINAMLQAGDTDAADLEIKQATALGIGVPGSNQFAARVAIARQDPEAALVALEGLLPDFLQPSAAEKVKALPETASVALVSLGTSALLMVNKLKMAEALLEAGLARYPGDQSLLARLATCWQMQGDVRAQWLCGFEKLVRSVQIVPPDGMTTASFNAMLAERLRAAHTDRHHPPDQTLRGGTQTFGKLFETTKDPLIGELGRRLKSAVDEFVSLLPEDPGHPFLSRRKAAVRFAGSWSARLRPGGFHTNHLHPEGWISSAYYVDVPEVASDQSLKEGWFSLGESDLRLGGGDQPQRMIQPKVGSLVLFPSYVWHGTIPFSGSAERLTVAFDVVPVDH